jgi:hypothetical protein
MSALRKPSTSPTPNAGHRWSFIKMLMESDAALSADAGWMLCVLLMHHGDEGLVNPGIRRLAHMTRMSPGRCMAARDELLAFGLITEDRGSGTRSSVYHLVALDAWYEARSSVRNLTPSVPDSGSSVHPVGTNPCLTPDPEKEDRPVLRIVPSKGWLAVVERATEEMRRFWLNRVELVDQGPEGAVRLTTPSSLHREKVLGFLAPGGELHDLALAAGVDPGKVTVEGPAHAMAPPRPPTVPLTARGMNEMAQRLEDASDTVVLPPVLDGKTVSLAAYRTKREDLRREKDDEDQR